MTSLRPPAVDSEAESQTIIGFTEAELGLVLAVVFLVLWVVGNRPIAKAQEPPVAVVTKDSADRLAARADSLAAMNEVLELTLDSLRPKRSRMAPSCTEVRVANGPLLTVRVEGSNTYVVEGKSYTWAQLLEFTSLARAAAVHAKCRQQIRVTTDPDISAEAYNRALRRLRGQFYTSLLEAELQ